MSRHAAVLVAAVLFVLALASVAPALAGAEAPSRPDPDATGPAQADSAQGARQAFQHQFPDEREVFEAASPPPR